MARYCSDCTYLNPNKCKNDNKGCYKCEKIGKFMMANTPACDKFCNAYARKNYEKEVLYDEAKYLENITSFFFFIYIHPPIEATNAPTASTNKSPIVSTKPS